MSLNQIQVGGIPSQSASDGQVYSALGGKATETIVAELHGKYYTQTYRGYLFHGINAAAAAIPANGTALTGFVLWNPSGNIKNLVPVRMTAGWSATTEAPGNIQLAFLAGAGATIATAAPVSAFTAATPQNGLLGGGNATTAKFGTAATLTTAGTVLTGTGWSHLTTTGTATFGSFQYTYEYDGSLIIPPGVLVYPVASTATASTYNITIVWYEAPF
jgi:hypothetical protein